MLNAPLLTSINVVCRSKPQIFGEKGLVLLIESFLDPTPLWTVVKATAPRTLSKWDAFPSQFQLLKRVAAREEATGSIDPYLKQKRFADALENAFQCRRIDIVKWLVEEYLPTGVIYTREYFFGNLEILQWVHEHHGNRVTSWGLQLYNLSPTFFEDRDEDELYSMLTWFHEHVTPVDDKYTTQIVLIAAKVGDLELLEWMSDLEPMRILSVLDILATAAKSGQTNILEWAVQSQGVSLSESQMNSAISGGQLETAQWLVENGVKSVKLDSIFEAASNMYFAAVKWALTNLSFEATNCEYSIGDILADYGQLEIIQQLHDLGLHFCTTETMDYAAHSGHLDVVQWLHMNRKEGCTKYAMDYAAGGNHLDVVKWLHNTRSEGCTTLAMDAAASNGHLEVLRWLHANRSEGCTVSAMNDAARNGHLAVVKWLHENRSEGCTTAAMNGAAEAGHLDMLKFLHEHRSEGFTSNAMTGAAKRGHIEVVKWLHLDCGDKLTLEAVQEAATGGHAELLKWLLQQHLDFEIDSTAVDQIFLRCPLEIAIQLYEDGRFIWGERAVRFGLSYRAVEASCWMWSKKPEDMSATLQSRYNFFQSREFEKIQDAIAPGWRDRMVCTK